MAKKYPKVDIIVNSPDSIPGASPDNPYGELLPIPDSGEQIATGIGGLSGLALGLVGGVKLFRSVGGPGWLGGTLGVLLVWPLGAHIGRWVHGKLSDESEA